MNLLCFIPQDHDATSFYRALQPLAQLRHILPDLRLSFCSNVVTVKDVAHMDLMFVQRPYGRDHLNLIDLAHNMSVPVWVDYDDYLLGVPDSNPAAAEFNNDQTRANIREVCQKADVISVSTQALAHLILPHVKRSTEVHIIPNALNDYLLTEEPTFKKHNVAFWRGTESHREDFQLYLPQMIPVMHDNPKYLFHFMGYKPWMLPKRENVVVSGGMEIMNYHRMGKQIFPNVCYSLLSDSEFNRAKSNIAWLEATYFGSPFLGPDLPEWKKPGVSTYTPGGMDFGLELQKMIQLPADEKIDRVATSWKYVRENLLLSKVNFLRRKLIHKITGKSQ